MSGVAVINGGVAVVSTTGGVASIELPDEGTIGLHVGNDLDLVHSLDVRNIVKITQTAYDALSPPVATTLYIIIP